MTAGAEPLPLPEHRVALWVRVADCPEVAVGTARSVADVPRLLRAIADRWEFGLLLDSSAPGRHATGGADVPGAR